MFISTIQQISVAIRNKVYNNGFVLLTDQEKNIMPYTPSDQKLQTLTSRINRLRERTFSNQQQEETTMKSNLTRLNKLEAQMKVPTTTNTMPVTQSPTIEVMSSLDLLTTINRYRLEDGKKEMRHCTFLKRIEDEFEKEELNASIYQDTYNRDQKCYLLDKEQALQVAMRESKNVRKRVIVDIKRLTIENKQMKEQVNTVAPVAPTTHQIPQTLSEALLLAGSLAQEVEQGRSLMLQAAPKVAYYEEVINSDGGLRTGEVASEAGMSSIKLNRLLAEFGVQRKVNKRWVLNIAYTNKGYGIESTYVDTQGRAHNSLMWTQAGREMILGVIKNLH